MILEIISTSTMVEIGQVTSFSSKEA